MAKNQHRKGPRRDRRISVRGVRRDSPDLRKLSRAVIQMALEQAAAEVAAEAQVRQQDQETRDA